MKKDIAILWNASAIEGELFVTDGKFESVSTAKESGGQHCRFAIHSEDHCRIECSVAYPSPQVRTMIYVDTRQNPFSFFASDVSDSFPIYLPSFGVIVTKKHDHRTYREIEDAIKNRGLLTNLQRIELDPEEDYDTASMATRSLPGQTWLGISRDMRIFGVNLRSQDVDGISERLWDWVQPRFHGYEVGLPESDDKPVRYQFLLGRGISCVQDVSRRLEDSVLPILHGRIKDDDIVYDTVWFVSLESSDLNKNSVRGTHFLVADGYGHGHMFTEEQERLRAGLLPEEMSQDEETVLYFRATAVNTASFPRYAWFKSVFPNSIEYSFDGGSGLGKLVSGRVYAVSKLNGQPLASEESAVLLMPGEIATFEFYLPHRPISTVRAQALIAQDFAVRHAQCREYWMDKLKHSANIQVPEKRITDMLQAGALHLDLVCYGLEPEGTLVPTIGVYNAIGSESSPIIQFMDSIGWSEAARRSLSYFLDKQHEDGFIQNFGGYMLETGAALWTLCEHFRYTQDHAWIQGIAEKMIKSCDYIINWRRRNQADSAQLGYGLLDGKCADPEDPFRSFMLNGYAYLGLARAAEMLADYLPEISQKYQAEAEALRNDIHTAVRKCLAMSPVVPLGDGSWSPTLPPWVGYRGPVCLYADGGNWVSHGTVTVRDSLLGPLWLAVQEVFDPNDEIVTYLLNVHNELMCTRNVAFSQPYYSPHAWIHLKRGEVKPFLKAYYNGFAGLADRETYTFWEHYFHASPHKTHEEAWFLMQTRWMLYMEDNQVLNLLPGIPRQWMKDGNHITMQNVQSYFGPLSLQVESHLELGEIIAKVECHTGRKPERIRLRIPHPEGRRPTQVIGGIYDSQTESVWLDEFDGFRKVTVEY